MLAVRQRWFSPRAVLLHFELLVIVVGCGIATWWQAGRALGGNGLSWFYTFEWPVLAGIAAAGWWHLIHEDAATRAARLRKREQEVDPVHRQAEW
jgi:hypothetical protein